MLIYLCSPSLSQISLKNSFSAKIEMTRNKNRLFGRHFETATIFPQNNGFDSAYLYGANFIAKFLWESGFLRGVPWNPPWVPTEVKVPWSLRYKVWILTQ